MFMTATGLAFTSSSFTLYLGDLFEREVHVRAGTTRLRHALVTHVLSLPEAESLRLHESLAVLMCHSLKHQQTTYCDISRQDRTFLSLDLVNKSVAEATSSKKPRVESCAESSCPRKVVDTQHGEIYVGDMVGLVYSAEDAVVFVGSVVKIRANEVLLKWHYHLNFFFIIQKYNVCLIFFPNFKAKFVHLPDFFAILICQFYGRH